MSRKTKKTHLQQRKVYSEDFKKRVVKQIERGTSTVLEASRDHGLHYQTVYTWLYKYSRSLHKNEVLVVEHKSEQYRRKELEQRIKDLEAALGRKQMEIDMLNKLIEIADKEHHTDIKKIYQRCA